MKIFKDFWYLFFYVEIGGKRKYFLNYSRAKEYYWAQVDVSRAYYGWHILGGYQCFHMLTAYKPMDAEEELLACQKYYDRWSSGGNSNMVMGPMVISDGWTAEGEE